MHIKEQLEKIRSMTSDLMLKQSRAEVLHGKTIPSSSDSLAWQARELQVLEEQIKTESSELESLRSDASAMIASLHDNLMEYILLSRYLDGLTWREISERSGYSRTWITKLHARGIKMLSARSM